MVSLNAFEKGLLKLEDILEMEENEIVRDATIQRFEFTFELAWKAFRTFLREAHGIVCNSPKSCFREGLSLGLYDAETTESLLTMVDDRNSTTHTYNENAAEEIYTNIKTMHSVNLRLLYKSIK
jgi:nucleotidyltransferase substrate binding protein (TIGR01987 family)